MLMDAEHSVVVVIDIQEKLAPAINDVDDVLSACDLVLKTAERLEVPIVTTEQYPRGLGPTLERYQPYITEPLRFEKIDFSATGDPSFMEMIDQLGRREIVIVGIEAHVCVLQTVLELCTDNREVYVVADAVGSRTAENKALGLERMKRAGAEIVSGEMVMFEWLRRAGTPEFKELSSLLKKSS